MRTVKRKRGDVLMPERFPENVIQGLKAKAREWATQYAQDPTPESGVIFTPAWWRYYQADAAPEFELVVLSVDCAFKSGKENDLVAIQKWGMVGARSYLIEREAQHLGYVATKGMIRSMQHHGRPASTILIEDKANGTAIVEELKADPEFGAAVIAVNPDGDKTSRAHAASTDVEAGSVYLPEEAPWLPEFLRTLATFPAARFDDDVDALSQFLNWRRTRSLSLGLVDYFKKLAAGAKKMVSSVEERLRWKPQPGAAEPTSPLVTKDQWLEWCDHHKAPPCPHPECKSTATVILNCKLHCNACGRDDGRELPKTPGTCCGNFLPQHVSGQIRCGNCGTQTSSGAVIAGMSRKDYAAGVGRHRAFGKF